MNLTLTPDPNIMQVVSGPVLWSPDEDKLLHAIVHEFGSNWSLVCDVLASSTALQGIARNWRQCKDRYKEIQVSGVWAGCNMIQVGNQHRAEDKCWVRDVGKAWLHMGVSMKKSILGQHKTKVTDRPICAKE